MLAARVEPKNGPGRLEGLVFAEEVELRRVVVTSGCDGVVVTAYLSEVCCLELQGELLNASAM
jgi:hypothetical protein